jgi:VCBS repeat-containing protein
LSNREEDTEISIKISVVCGENIISRDVNITLKALEKPTAKDISIEVNENDNITNNVITVTKTSGNNDVTFDELEFVSAEKNNINNINLAAYGIDDLSKIAQLENNGNFTFNPSTYFISMSGNETITLKLKYTITDNEYGNSGFGYIFVTIKGQATPPINPDEQLKIDNSDDINYEPQQTITVTKNEILTNWELPENADNYKISSVGNITYETGFDGENNFATNPFENNSLGSAEIDSDGNIVFTPDETIAKTLSNGQWIEIKIEYSLQNIHDANGENLRSSSIIIKITGQNEKPEFNEIPFLEIEDSEILEIQWENYFQDIDLNDTLKITKINDQPFDENNAIIINDVGKFYFDNGKLLFSPAEKFKSLKKDSSEKLTLNFTVEDSSLATATGDFEINVIGTNKAPQAENQEKTIENGENITFKLDNISDLNDGDQHKIDNIEIKISERESIILDQNTTDHTVTLDNGIVITFNVTENTITLDTAQRSKLPDDGKPEKIELVVTISDDSGETCISNWSTIITNKPPQIENELSYTYIYKVEDTGSYKIDLTENINDLNIPNRDQQNDTWEISDLKILDEIDNELKNTIQNSLELENNDLTFKPSSDLLEYLKTNIGEGKTFEIQLSYLVTDKLLTDSNGDNLSTEGKLILQIYGKKAAEIEVENMKIDLAKLQSDSQVTVSDQSEITISDPDKILNANDYNIAIDYDSIQISGTQQTNFDSFNFESVFKIDSTDSTTNKIQFTDNADMFAPLNAGEKLMFTFNIVVTDSYGTTATKPVTITIIGKGDPAVVTTSDNLTIWSNKRNNNSEVHDVNYEIDDPDYGENHTYSFGGLQNSDSENIPLQDDDNVISVDNTNGKITFNENFFDLEFLKNLTGDSVFTILINIRGGNDQLINQAELKLNIKVAKSPEIKIEHQEIDANENIENLQISVIDNNTGTLPESDNYSYSKPVLAENINISDEIKNKIDATINEKGQFNFNPDNIFDYLSKNKSITLTFNFTVTDKIYNVESGSSIIVTINGVNEKPIFNDIQTIDAGQITFDENNNGIEIILSELFSDADKNDKHKVVSINDVTITNDWTTIDGLGQFKYTETDENGFDGKLFYRAFVPLNENNELEKLSAKLNELNFTIKIQDNSNENNNTSEGEIKIAVIGANSQPVINKNKIDDTIDENTISEKYLLRDFITDKNINDDFTFNTINGEQILTPSDNSAETQTIVISDGTKIIVSSDRKSFQIDATSRYENLQPNKIVLNSILVTISDNSQTENAISPPCSIQFKIKGINDPPQLNDQHFGINLNDLNSADSSGTKKYIGTISITDIDTVTENYNFTISPENENGNENTTPSIELKNEKNGVSIYIDENDIPSLEGDESVSYKFKITAATSDGETANAQIIITFSNKPKLQVEFVDNDDNLIISESETETETLEKEVRVTSNNEETAAADYSYTNVRFVEGTIQNDNQPNNNQSNNNQSTEQIFVLPQGVEFGFDSDKFYIKPNGKFDFLGDNEKITLIFEFTVFDNINYIGTSQRINVTINGENSAPVANDAKAEVDIPINNTTGYKFYLTDLFADIDRNDSINEIFVNNTKFTIAGNVKDIYQDNIKYGTIKFDSINQCLIFIPDSDFPIRSNEIYLLKFQIAVTDQSGIKSNSGEITIGLRGVNKPPKFNDNINLITNENEKLIINAAEIANDSNGDPLKIISVTDGNETIEINGNSKTITLQSGAVLTLTESGQLIYDPINRTNNLSKDKSDKETIRLIIADEYENGTSHTDWKTLEITVKGVNDNPVDIKSEQTEIIGNLKGEEQKIKLSEYFNDPDNDILSYEILNTIDNNSFVENWKIEGIENEFYLVIKFKSDYYSDNIQFNSAELNLQVKDSNGGEIKKTFIVKLPPTVKLDINTDDNIEDDTYTVTVTAFDLINELLGYSYSNGFTSIKFSINFNPELCEIVENSISAAGEIKDFGYAIFVEITADQIAEMMTSADTNLSNLTLISFKVKSISSGAAEFSIGNYLEIFRNNNLISNSQIACSNNTTTQ